MQIAFLTFSLDLSCFNIALDLFHTLASEPQLFGRAAVGKPICIVGHTNQGDNRIHNGGVNPRQVPDRGPADQCDGDVLCEIAVVDIIGTGNGGQRMAAMAHSIQGFPIINLFHPGEVLQSMDLVAQSLADGQPLPVEQYVDLETRGLETVLIQEEGEVWFFDIA